MRKLERDGEVSVQGRGLRKYPFSSADLKGVIYVIITITCIFQWFDVRPVTAPWPRSNVVNVNYRVHMQAEES